MKQLHFYIVLALLFSTKLNAQEYLIRQFPLLDTVEKKFGANHEHYNAMLYGFGFMGGPTDSSGSNIEPLRSFYITYGGRYKRKVSSFFNVGCDYFFEYRNFCISQSKFKVIGGRAEHENERYVQFTVNLGLFSRFNLSKRGNHLGKYIDIFVNGIYSPINRYYVYEDTLVGGGAKKSKLVYSKLAFANKFFAQVGLRYGISFFQIQAFYRPVNMFRKPKEFPYPELPRFGLGLMIDIEDLYKNN